MPDRLRTITSWITLLALAVTALMSSGAMVRCVEAGDHAAIEWSHGEGPCAIYIAEASPDRGAAASVADAAPCVDELLPDIAVAQRITVPTILFASPAIAPDFDRMAASVRSALPRGTPEDTAAPWESPVTQATRLLI